jgi:hypothetical protein
MSAATIRSALKSIILTIDDTGAVYDYSRWTSTWDGFLDLFRISIAGDMVVRGWEIEYRGFTPGGPEELDFVFMRQHHFFISGYLQVNDAAESEKAAAALAEELCDALDANAGLHGGDYYDTSAATLALLYREFSGVLCHQAQISINVTEQVNV